MEKLQAFLKGWQGPLLILFLGACAAFPLALPNSYYVHVATLVLLYAILALGLNLIVGLVGLLNLGYAAFYGLGAYTSALLAVNFGWGFWVSLPAAVLVAALSGVLLGTPALRLRGDYLAIVTLGFGEIFRLVASTWDSLT